jgi:hypothetical protein
MILNIYLYGDISHYEKIKRPPDNRDYCETLEAIEISPQNKRCQEKFVDVIDMQYLLVGIEYLIFQGFN